MADLPSYRPCDLCGGVDTDPRHSFAGVIDNVWEVDPTVEAVLADNLERLVGDGTISMGDALRIGGDFHDTTSTDRHMDCCAEAGCPLAGTEQDEHACGHRVAASGGKTGAAMRKAALSLAQKEG